jgi:hypothetical protein
MTVFMPSASATRQACCPPAPPKLAKRVFRDVIAALDRDLLDRVGHVLDGDPQEAFGDLMRAAAIADLLGRARQANFSARCPASSGSSEFGPKTAGKWAGFSLPSMTLQSVTVSGPPLR